MTKNSVLDRLVIEKGFVEYKGLSKVELSSIKNITLDVAEDCYPVVLHIKGAPSITWVFDTNDTAKQAIEKIKSKL